MRKNNFSSFHVNWLRREFPRIKERRIQGLMAVAVTGSQRENLSDPPLSPTACRALEAVPETGWGVREAEGCDSSITPTVPRILMSRLPWAKTQSPRKDDSSSFQKVKEDLVPSDQSKLRPFCGEKLNHHFLAVNAGGISQCCLSSPQFTHGFLFPLLDIF